MAGELTPTPSPAPSEAADRRAGEAARPAADTGDPMPPPAELCDAATPERQDDAPSERAGLRADSAADLGGLRSRLLRRSVVRGGTRFGRAMLEFGVVVAKRVVLLGVLLAVVFVAVDLLPGDAARATSERGESAADVGRRRVELGLDRPVLERFWDWMTGLPSGNLGVSARGVPVRELVSGAFPNTLLLGGLALLLTAVCSLALGCWAALRPGRPVDRVVSGSATAILALPEFVVAIALMEVLSLWTGWLPAVTLAGADGAPAAWNMLVLPVLALAIPQTGWNVRIVRAALADEASEPHVEAAVLDGLSPRRVLLRHVLPGAVPAIVTGLATSTGMLLGGAVAVEVVFNYPGIGSVLASAATDRDAPLVAGVTALTGAAITVVLLVADLARDALAGGRR